VKTVAAFDASGEAKRPFAWLGRGGATGRLARGEEASFNSASGSRTSQAGFIVEDAVEALARRPSRAIRRVELCRWREGGRADLPQSVFQVKRSLRNEVMNHCRAGGKAPRCSCPS